MIMEAHKLLLEKKEEHVARALAQAIMDASAAQYSPPPHGPVDIHVSLLRLSSSSETPLSMSLPRTNHSPSPPRSDYSSPASFLARMWADNEEFAATSPLAPAASGFINMDAVLVLRELSVQGEMLEHHKKMMKHIVNEQTELRQLVAELKGILLTPPGAAGNAPPPGPSLSTAAASPLQTSCPTLAVLPSSFFSHVFTHVVL